MVENSIAYQLNEFAEVNRKVVDGMLYGVELMKDILGIEREGFIYTRVKYIRRLQCILYSLNAGEEQDGTMYVRWYTDENDAKQMARYSIGENEATKERLEELLSEVDEADSNVFTTQTCAYNYPLIRMREELKEIIDKYV